MTSSTVLSRDIVTSRFMFNMMKRINYNDSLKNTMIGDLKWSAQQTSNLLTSKGWVVCDGRSLSRTDYEELFEVIGTRYGSDNSTTFKVPDCRGRVLGAIGEGVGLTLRNVNDKIGTETHTLSIGEMPTHNHGGATGSASAGSSSDGNVDVGGDGNNVATGSHSHSIAPAGSNMPHNNMQPTIFISNVYIYSGKFEPDAPSVDVLGLNEISYQV